MDKEEKRGVRAAEEEEEGEGRRMEIEEWKNDTTLAKKKVLFFFPKEFFKNQVVRRISICSVWYSTTKQNLKGKSHVRESAALEVTATMAGRGEKESDVQGPPFSSTSSGSIHFPPSLPQSQRSWEEVKETSQQSFLKLCVCVCLTGPQGRSSATFPLRL